MSKSQTDTLRRYKKLTTREHIITRPDTYVGSISLHETEEFIIKNDRMVFSKITYNPALLKLFDEIITNASDHSRNNNVKIIEVDVTNDSISVKNDGPSIHIDIHPDHGIHIPEMIFGNFHSGTNFDDTEQRTVGGRNGYGAKLVAVFSKKFIIEIVKDGQRYYQEFHDGLTKINPPKIKKTKLKDYTKITYFPDFSHFGVTENDVSHIDLYKRRSYDIAACTPKKTAVKFNGEKVPIVSLESYVKLFISDDTPRVMINQPNWQVCFVLNEQFDKFMQVSFVNGIFTKEGGTHVTHVVQPVVKSIIDKLSNSSIVIRESFVKDNIFVFINCLIVNPTFNSQIKHRMTLTSSKFGSSCEIKNEIKKIIKLGIDKNVLAIANAKQNKTLAKSDGKKKKKLTGVENLEDANDAGTKNSLQCTLFITEGLSAKTFFMSGIPKSERDSCGVFPVKGKLLNVRNANIQTISKNKEICSIKTALGLKQDLKNINEIKNNLRYGKVTILTDADSVTGNTPIMLKKGNYISVTKIKNIGKNFKPLYAHVDGIDIVSEKEYSSGDGFEVWTENGWSKIKHVMRHMAHKNIYTVCSAHGLVEVTEDHSLITKNGDKIAPKNLQDDTELLHFNSPEMLLGSGINFGEEAFFLAYFSYHGVLTFDGNNDVLVLVEVVCDERDVINYLYTLLNHVYGNGVFMKTFTRRGFPTIMSKEPKVLEKFRRLFFDEEKYRKGTLMYASNKIHDDILNMDTPSFEIFYKEFQKLSYSICGYFKKFSVKSMDVVQKIFLIHLRHDPTISIEWVDDFEYRFVNNVTNFSDEQIFISVGEKQNGYVYDLETENHHFQAGIGSMIVHNTDGSHIKGLIVNFIGQYWPELLKIDFVTFMQTPVVVCKKGKHVKKFYNLTEYDLWKNANDVTRWSSKYYKGLGTSSSSEAKECFEDFRSKTTSLTVTKQTDMDSLSLAFDKERSDDRKEWIINSTGKNIFLESSARNVNIKRFIDEELVLFSIADNVRSLPSLIDGLKPSQRKVLYGTLLKNTTGEIKMEHLRGFISEKTAYHHGEASLNGTIFGMNQDFVGSNNINLLSPRGQLGCLDPNTDILLWNGKIKKAIDIVESDTLVGDDGTPRKILKLVNGMDTMYEIKTPRNKYKVNSIHILTLKFVSVFEKFDKQWETYYLTKKGKDFVFKRVILGKIEDLQIVIKQDETSVLDNIIDIKVSDYLNLPNIVKRSLYTFSLNHPIVWTERKTQIEPYTFGVSISDNIPDDYIHNSISVRLKVLAGIIDNVGELKQDKNLIEIPLIKITNRMHKSVTFLCNTLGYVTDKIKNNMVITGKYLHKIPTKTVLIKGNSDVNVYNEKFTICQCVKGPFCGWQIDKNERFLLGNFIITHNSRQENGSDAAAPRYVSTMLNPITRFIFRKEDDPILTHLYDDGFKIEPVFFQPIIPMLLVNGCIGIGTGFSISVPPYNPLDIISSMLDIITHKPVKPLTPWFKGFKGTITEMTPKSYQSRGIYKLKNRSTVVIEEIPIGCSINNYKLHLEKLLEENVIEDFSNRSTDKEIDFTVTMNAIKIRDNQEKLTKILGLESIVKKSDINCFDENNKLQTFKTPEDIMNKFYIIRKKFYKKRYDHHLNKMNEDLILLSAKIRFIMGIISGEIKVFRQKNEVVVSQLTSMGFPMLESSYEYLLNIRVSSFTEERVKSLESDHEKLNTKCETLKSKNYKDLWVSDLKELKSKLKSIN
jgi:DNA gyrase/topoisomerase IV subunit B